MTDMNRIYVVYHSPCPDGMAAAWAAWRRLGDAGVRYIPMSYGQPVPQLKPGSDLIFVDFTFKRGVMLELAAVANSILVLDHHESAEADLVDLPENVRVVFDMTRSGAQLSWAHFFPGEPEPKVLSHIADRDLWKFEIPNTREITEAVMAAEYDFSVYDNMIAVPLVYNRLLMRGEALLAQKEQHLSFLLKEAQAAKFSTPWGSAEVPVVNAPFFLGSDLANRLLELYPNAPFAATYRDGGDGRRDWSLRSTADRESVSVVAVYNGGGGHRNAAGINETHPNHLVALLGRRYE